MVSPRFPVQNLNRELPIPKVPCKICKAGTGNLALELFINRNKKTGGYIQKLFVTRQAIGLEAQCILSKNDYPLIVTRTCFGFKVTV